jgi:hypothetical protein
MSIDEMASRLIGSERQVSVARELARMWRCLLSRHFAVRGVASASTDVGTNGIDQRCGWGEARPLALVDRRYDGHTPGRQPLE